MIQTRWINLYPWKQKAILAGHCTQTRAIRPEPKPPIKSRLFSYNPSAEAVPDILGCPYGKPGDRLEIGEIGCVPLCLVELESTREERLHKISEADAVAEGHLNREDFKSRWIAQHGFSCWERNPLVWVLTFRKVEP